MKLSGKLLNSHFSGTFSLSLSILCGFLLIVLTVKPALCLAITMRLPNNKYKIGAPNQFCTEQINKIEIRLAISKLC